MAEEDRGSDGWLGVFAVVAFALVWYGQMGGWVTVDPRNISWMLAGDWHGHLFGWLFTRNGPWTLPFGLAPDLMYPYGSSAAFTDAIPIASVTSKVLSPLLPQAFQFFGLWMCGCVIAQGLVGFQFAWRRFGDVACAALAGMLFATDPIIAGRYGHPPFFAQFVVLGLVGLAVLPVSLLHQARRRALAALAFNAFACGVNAYLGVIASAVTLAVVVRLGWAERWFKPKEALAWTVACPATAASSFWFFGFFAGVKGPIGQLGAEGFGQFSADLLTFVNPIYWSRILPGIRTGPRQGEGYAYLGFGVLLLLALALAHGVRALTRGERPTLDTWRRIGPILAMSLLLGFYALSYVITFAGTPVATLPGLYSLLGNLTNVFRSSGRFIWPLHSLLALAAVLGVSRLSDKVWTRRLILGAALLVQVYDLDLSKGGFRGPFTPFQPLANPAWSTVNQGYQHVYIHPVMAQWVCPYDETIVSKFSWVAYTQHLTINSGLVGRNPPDMPSRCMRHLQPNELDPETIYYVHFPEFAADLINAGFECGVVDGLTVCVTPKKETPLRRAVNQQRVGLRPGQVSPP